MSREARLVVLVCAAQALAQVGAYAWPALLPGFLERWQLDNASAGTLTSLFYGAYLASVPVLVSLTDRIDPRRIYLFGVACTLLGHGLFAFVADGPLVAGLARILAGIGFAGSYMTGLKLLGDRIEGRLFSRATAGHAASIGIAGALSFAAADAVAGLFGWRGAFAAAFGCAAVSLLIALIVMPKAAPKPQAGPPPKLFDFGPVFRNRSAMAYAIAYCVHTWEMSVVRGWGVVFLAAVAAGTVSDGTDGFGGWPAPAVFVTLLALAGTFASIFGNEMSIRLGRQSLVRLAMALSAAMALLIGWLGPYSYGLAATLIVVYGVVIWLDSSSLTAGAAGSAEPSRRGATLAVHSMLGFGGGFVGPIVMGLVLDWAAGSGQAWLIGFAHVAVVMLVGRIVFMRLRPQVVAGDRA